MLSAIFYNNSSHDHYLSSLRIAEESTLKMCNVPITICAYPRCTEIIYKDFLSKVPCASSLLYFPTKSGSGIWSVCTIRYTPQLKGDFKNSSHYCKYHRR